MRCTARQRPRPGARVSALLLLTDGQPKRRSAERAHRGAPAEHRDDQVSSSPCTRSGSVARSIRSCLTRLHRRRTGCSRLSPTPRSSASVFISTLANLFHDARDDRDAPRGARWAPGAHRPASGARRPVRRRSQARRAAPGADARGRAFVHTDARRSTRAPVYSPT